MFENIENFYEMYNTKGDITSSPLFSFSLICLVLSSCKQPVTRVPGKTCTPSGKSSRNIFVFFNNKKSLSETKITSPPGANKTMLNQMFLLYLPSLYLSSIYLNIQVELFPCSLKCNTSHALRCSKLLMSEYS